MSHSTRFILIAYLFSLMIWLPGILSTYGLIGEIPWLPLFAIGTCGPLVAALWCIWHSDGWIGVKAWLKRASHNVFPGTGGCSSC